jgi:peroxiredoxin Q/BCP
MLTLDSAPPAFTLPGSDGKNHSPSDYAGKYLLIFFYPKDDTPGCTIEACQLRDNWKNLQAAGCTVLGVSKDSIESHEKFITKYDLPFVLLSDESTEMIAAYGAWQEKSMYGKKYLGISRISYLIGPDGNVAKVYAKVKPKEHAAEVLADIESMA